MTFQIKEKILPEENAQKRLQYCVMQRLCGLWWMRSDIGYKMPMTMNGDQHHCQWDLFKSVSSNNEFPEETMFISSRWLHFIQLLGYILSSYDILDIHLLRWNKKEWFPGVWWRPAPLPREIRHLSLHSVAPQSPPTIHTGKPYYKAQSQSLYRFQQRGIIMSNLSCVCPKDSVAPLAAFWLEGVALPSVGGLGLVGNVATIIVLRYSFMEMLLA